MKQIRLLPVLILAGLALFVLKGVGIVTNGGYVLTGTSTAEAAGGGGHGEAPAEGGENTLALPPEPTMTDASPTLDDGAPTLPLRAGDEGAAEGAHGNEHGEPAPKPVAATPCVQGPVPEKEEQHGGAEGDDLPGFDFIKEAENCIVDPGVNEAGDALPLVKDGGGNIVPLEAGQATPSEEAVLERLGERRDELDTREAELDMRMALVEAAEKRIEERTAVLEALEARINAMVDEKRALEESQFVAVVAMYETMKPKDAAAIFDQLDMSVLLRVASAMNPRRMAPIMAKMDPSKAKELTAGMAVDQVEPTIELTGEDLASLPQIVGQ